MEDVMGNCIFHIDWKKEREKERKKERKKESRNFVIEASKNSREDTHKYDRSITGVCARRWRKGRNIPTDGQSVVAEYI